VGMMTSSLLQARSLQLPLTEGDNAGILR
jgi:hypothetical protein